MRRIFLLLSFFAAMALMVGCSASIDVETDSTYTVSGQLQNIPSLVYDDIEIYEVNKYGDAIGDIVNPDKNLNYKITGLKPGKHYIAAVFYALETKDIQMGSTSVTISSSNIYDADIMMINIPKDSAQYAKLQASLKAKSSTPSK